MEKESVNKRRTLCENFGSWKFCCLLLDTRWETKITNQTPTTSLPAKSSRKKFHPRKLFKRHLICIQSDVKSCVWWERSRWNDGMPWDQPREKQFACGWCAIKMSWKWLGTADSNLIISFYSDIYAFSRSFHFSVARFSVVSKISSSSEHSVVSPRFPQTKQRSKKSFSAVEMIVVNDLAHIFPWRWQRKASKFFFNASVQWKHRAEMKN